MHRGDALQGALAAKRTLRRSRPADPACRSGLPKLLAPRSDPRFDDALVAAGEALCYSNPKVNPACRSGWHLISPPELPFLGRKLPEIANEPRLATSEACDLRVVAERNATQQACRSSLPKQPAEAACLPHLLTDLPWLQLKVAFDCLDSLGEACDLNVPRSCAGFSLQTPPFEYDLAPFSEILTDLRQAIDLDREIMCLCRCDSRNRVCCIKRVLKVMEIKT